MKNPFTAHPQTIGETYSEHLKFASKFGLKMLLGGSACLIHALFPFIFQKTGSQILLKLIHEFLQRMPLDERKVKLEMLTKVYGSELKP